MGGSDVLSMSLKKHCIALLDSSEFQCFFCVTKNERRSVHKQVRHDLQNARKTTAPWITGPTGSGRPQPHETKESAHQSHPTPATPAVRKETSEQPRTPAETTSGTAKPDPPVSASTALASGLGSCQETNKSQRLRRPAPASLQRQDHKPSSAARQQKLRIGPLLPSPCLDQNCTAQRWGVPSACKGHTRAVSTASCLQPPRAVCCPSSLERSHQGPSQTNQWRLCHQPRGRSSQLRSQGQNHVSPALQLDCKLRGGGQESQEDGQRRRNKLKSCGSMRVCRLEGVVVNATPAPVPLCDRIKALSASVN